MTKAEITTEIAKPTGIDKSYVSGDNVIPTDADNGKWGAYCMTFSRINRREGRRSLDSKIVGLKEILPGQATQKAYSVAEIKWTDRFARNPTELKSLLKFVNTNPGLRKIIVTTKTETGIYHLDGGEDIIFVPSALYSLWIVDYLFSHKNPPV